MLAREFAPMQRAFMSVVMSVVIPVLKRTEFNASYPNLVLGDAGARHSTVNGISLYKVWFDTLAANDRAAALIHEMGHLSQTYVHAYLTPFLPIGLGLGLLYGKSPSDRSNSDACDGKCYAEYPMQGNALACAPNMFNGLEPRALVTAWEAGTNNTYTDMMKNIDNYVCYMWNRWMDRKACEILRTGF